MATDPSQRLEEPKSAFRQGVILNWVSLVFLGLSGIALNVVVSRFYDPATLGVFNQVLAAYVVLSMVASGGLHLSALRTIAAHAHRTTSLPAIVLGAFLPGLLLSAVVTAFTWVAAPLLGELLESPRSVIGLRAVAPGLFFFALNKTLFGIVNGLERMRAYALLQSLRYILILAGLGMAVWLEVEGALLAGIFSFAEGVLFVVLLLEISLRVPWWNGGSGCGEWGAMHLRYGVKAVLSGLLLELNGRVDVLMIGYFLNDESVGIYSYAILFAEGFFQLIVVLQNSYNPILAKALAERDFAAVSALTRKARLWIYPVIGAIGLVSIPIYPIVLGVLTGQPSLAASHLPYTVLVAGIVLAAGYLPFLNVLSMGNLPGWHSILMMGFVSVNVVGNLILVPPLGITGAAVATSATFVTGTLLLILLARLKLGLRL